MVYRAVKNNKIIHVCETNSEKDVVKSMAYEGITDYDAIEAVPNDYYQGKVGNDIREFDGKFELLPLSQRKDYVSVPEGMKIEGEDFVLMTVKEKIDSGLTVLAKETIYDDELKEIRMKTLDELLADKIITKEVWYDNKLTECLNQRKYAYRSESDPLKNELEFDGKDLKAWKDKVVEIKSRFPKPIIT